MDMLDELAEDWFDTKRFLEARGLSFRDFHDGEPFGLEYEVIETIDLLEWFPEGYEDFAAFMPQRAGSLHWAYIASGDVRACDADDEVLEDLAEWDEGAVSAWMAEEAGV